MKVSLNWVKEFTDIKLSVDELVTKIGAQLGAVEEVIEYGPRYNNIVVAKIASCVQHPNADKLSLCTIDDGGITPDVNRGENGYVQVVCGAPNVKEGLMVAWIPPGATVPSTIGGEPFVLEAREIRGHVSNGMLASPHELGISDNHDGILEIDDKNAKLGQAFKELYGLDDVVIDIENKMFTHRPDCFGVLGVARELAGIQGKQFISPSWYTKGQLSELSESGVTLNIAVATDLVSRFMAVAMENVTVAPSPLWLQAGLTRVGLKPINNIVDITNYLMYVTGQPLHAYDADKLPTKDTLGARMSRKGEKTNLLNGKELELLDDSSIVITSGDAVVGIGGIMGGKDTEVSLETKNIIIECASFDMYSIRRTSMKYGLFTDAVTRFTKGQSSLQNPFVLAQAVEMVKELSGGMQSSNAADAHGRLLVNEPIKVSTHFINDRLGSSLNNQQMAGLLTNVEFDVTLQDELIIKAPFWRTDIEIAEDVVEEIGRLYGYDYLPLVLPKRDITPAGHDADLVLKQTIRHSLARAGANELLTYSFVDGELFKKVGQDKEHAFELSNALSPELQYYRTSLTPSLLDKVHMNIKAGFGRFALYEINKVHFKDEWDADEPNVPNEDTYVALVVAADAKHQTAGAPYYLAIKYLEQISDTFGSYLVPLSDFDFSNNARGKQLAAPYEPSRSAVIVKDEHVWGVVGEFTPGARRALKLPTYAAGFEVHLDMLGITKRAYQPLPRFPKVEQDISLKVPSATTFASVYNVLANELLDKDGVMTTLTPLDIYQREGDDDHKQMAFRFTIAHYDKTLKSEEVNSLLDAAARVAEAELGAERL